MEHWPLFGLALGLGLLGFIEPCTIGAHLVFVHYLAGQSRPWQLLQTLIFALTRALVIGLFGAGAGWMGARFFHLQHTFWWLLGLGYVGIGVLYLVGKQDWFLHALGRKPQTSRTAAGTITLGFLLGLNLPACATPVFGAVLAASLGTATAREGFLMLALFGAALSLPLVLVVLWERARHGLAWLTRTSAAVPTWTGLVFVVLGLWSMSLGLRGP